MSENEDRLVYTDCRFIELEFTDRDPQTFKVPRAPVALLIEGRNKNPNTTVVSVAFKNYPGEEIVSEASTSSGSAQSANFYATAPASPSDSALIEALDRAFAETYASAFPEVARIFRSPPFTNPDPIPSPVSTLPCSPRTTPFPSPATTIACSPRTSPDSSPQASPVVPAPSNLHWPFPRTRAARYLNFSATEAPYLSTERDPN